MPGKKAADESVVKCRHCGAVPEETPTVSDWLCKKCERYQDFAICPTCGSAARASVVTPDEYQPYEVKSEEESVEEAEEPSQESEA